MADTKKKSLSVKATEDKKAKSLIMKRVTEKAALLAEKGAYTFNVPENFNKKMIAEMVKKEYKVTPIRVNITRATMKAVRRKGRPGVSSDSKKAVVWLKQGEKIEFV
ncbi:50S ribosomal protein L23 [bacterium]|nr:50S ribosomal protein L23 [bacterium]